MYARGLSVEDIQCQLQELYEVDISSPLISTVTASISDDVKAWQSPLRFNVPYPLLRLHCC
jgi:putative transposase